MDRRFLQVNSIDQVNRVEKLYIKIDGSALTTSLATAGVVLGANVCTAKDDGSNAVTITFARPLRRAPEILYTVYTDNCKLDSLVSSTTGITYTSVKADDHTTGVADADVYLELSCLEGVDLV